MNIVNKKGEHTGINNGLVLKGSNSSLDEHRHESELHSVLLKEFLSEFLTNPQIETNKIEVIPKANKRIKE